MSRWFARLLLLLFFTSIAFASDHSGKDTVSALQSASQRWQEQAKTLHVASFTVEVVNHARPVFQYSYGGRDCTGHKPPNANTIYYLASATKPFTAEAVVQLAEQKKLDLDAQVKRYLPRFELADAKDTESVTVRDLLSHRLGLSDFPIEIAEAFTGQMDDDKFYRLLKQVKPRGKFRYSNLHYTLLGRVIESVAGEPWSEYLHRHIFLPVGMKRTVTSESAIQRDRNSACAVEETDSGWKASFMQKTDRTMHAAGGIASTANDLGRWMQIQLNQGATAKGRILSGKSMKEMFLPQSDVGSKFFLFERKSYGIGWYLGSYRDVPMIHHFGSFEGARSHLSFLPGHDVAVVVLMNEETPVSSFVDAVASDVYDIFLHLSAGEQWQKVHESVEENRREQKTRWAGQSPLKAVDIPELANTIDGQYSDPDWGTLEISRLGESVLAHIGDMPIPLYYNPTTKDLGGEIADEPFAMAIEKGAIIFRHGKSMQLRFVRQAH